MFMPGVAISGKSTSHNDFVFVVLYQLIVSNTTDFAGITSVCDKLVPCETKQAEHHMFDIFYTHSNKTWFTNIFSTDRKRDCFTIGYVG